MVVVRVKLQSSICVTNVMSNKNNNQVDINTSSTYYLHNKVYNTSYTKGINKTFRLSSHLSNPITDTGASGNYAPEFALPYLVNHIVPSDDPTAQPINGQIIQSTHIAELNLPTLPKAARKVYIFRDVVRYIAFS